MTLTEITSESTYLLRRLEERWRGGPADPRITLVLATLFLVSAITAMILGVVMAWTGKWNRAYLGWNVFLAWVPLWLALLLGRLEARGASRKTRLAVGFAWLMFFPNAPYLVTDMVHLRSAHSGIFWLDLVLISLCAFLGLVVGFVSLYLVHSRLAGRFGWAAGWVFTAAVAGLSGFGVYLGRFRRWNSWDVLANPLGLSQDVLAYFADPINTRLAAGFPVLFAAFIFLTYVTLYALIYLNPASISDRSATARA